MICNPKGNQMKYYIYVYIDKRFSSGSSVVLYLSRRSIVRNRSYLPGRHLRDDAPDAPWPYEICDNASNTNCEGDLCVIRPRDQSQREPVPRAPRSLYRFAEFIEFPNASFAAKRDFPLQGVTNRACACPSPRPEAGRSLFCFGYC